MMRSLNDAVAGSDLAEPATLEPADGTAPLEVAGIFTEREDSFFPSGGDVSVAVAKPRLLVRLADLPVDAEELYRMHDGRRAWRFVARGNRYRVSDVEHDGDGMVRLVGQLEGAAP